MNDIRFKSWDVDSRYEIGTDGTVISNNYKNGGKRKEIAQQLDKDGYPYVFLFVDGKRYKRKVHRLVAEAFLEKPDGKDHVNHKNGVRNDNNLSNLEWVTHQENVQHSWIVNGRKHTERQRRIRSSLSTRERNPKAKLTMNQVLLLRKLRKSGKSLKELSQMFGIGVSQVSAIANGKYWNDNPDLLEGEKI